MKTITFQELKQIKNLGMVVLGAGGDLNNWINGISEILTEEKIICGDKPIFKESFKLTGNILGEKGRTDLILIFNNLPDIEINMGKLAIWRIKFGDISWIEDFITNYAKDYELDYDNVDGSRKEIVR